MFKKLLNKKLLKNQKGLTLIEVLAVIVILAIIAAIAIPAIGNIINNSRDKAILSEGLNIIAGAKLAKMDDVCDGSGSGAKACSEQTIADYVEGVKDGATYTAIYNGKEWTLKFSRFGDFKGDKFTVKDGVKENDMKEKIDSKK